MKTLEDIFKKTSKEQLKEISSLLSIKSVNENRLRSALLNIFSLSKIMSTFTPEELTILKLLYSDNDGISFGEIQKKTGIDVQQIEASMNVLSNNLFTYITKNRQLLNKKMDKAYCIEEIAETFKISAHSDIKEYLQNSQETMIGSSSGTNALLKIKDQKNISIIKEIVEKGGITSIKELSDIYQNPDYEKRILDLIDKKILFSISFNDS